MATLSGGTTPSSGEASIVHSRSCQRFARGCSGTSRRNQKGRPGKDAAGWTRASLFRLPTKAHRAMRWFLPTPDVATGGELVVAEMARAQAKLAGAVSSAVLASDALLHRDSGFVESLLAGKSSLLPSAAGPEIGIALHPALLDNRRMVFDKSVRVEGKCLF
mmetsp:Transcript_34078/g.108125  ORF Transcript_34078/g.108125 Transcript_34078/m.108125 type:complete len:162 (-) Transcript_34078:21-506(-)